MTGPGRGRYVEAPAPYGYDDTDPVAVFLAGGISKCPDWQADAAPVLLEAGLVVLNPRRATIDLNDPGLMAQQISWEFGMLNELPRLVTLFWFPASDPAETVQPIALFELGRATTNPPHPGQHLVVGTDPGYPRRIDVELQLRHARPDLIIHESLQATLAAAVTTAHSITATTASVEADARAWQPYDDHTDLPVVKPREG